MFAGFTPYYCGAIWLGYDTPKTMKNSGTVHLNVWKEIMSRVHEGKEDIGFARPEGIVSRTFCSASGMQPKSLCSRDYYGSNTAKSDLCASDFGSSSETCTFHKSYSVDLTTGKLANKYCGATSVVLAVNPETDEIVNKAVGEGKVDIDIHSTCTAHSASHPGYVVQKPKPKPKQPVDSRSLPIPTNWAP